MDTPGAATSTVEPVEEKLGRIKLTSTAATAIAESYRAGKSTVSSVPALEPSLPAAATTKIPA